MSFPRTRRRLGALALEMSYRIAAARVAWRHARGLRDRASIIRHTFRPLRPWRPQRPPHA